jgi:hypothetical protein
MLLALPALAQDNDPPDPTRITPAPQGEVNIRDVCDLDPRCRIARFRSELAHQRRLEYLARLDAASKEMERRIQKSKPFRVRYPYEANFVYISNVESFGALIAYAPTFWVKMEGYAAGFEDSSYANGGDFRFHGFSGGLDARFMPIKFPLAPYIETGWAYLSGSASYYNYEQDANAQGSAEAHLITLGLGIELTVPYFHFALGYQYQEAFYAQAIVGGQHDSTLRNGLKAGMENGRHGANLQIGCAF